MMAEGTKGLDERDDDRPTFLEAARPIEFALAALFRSAAPDSDSPSRWGEGEKGN